MRGATSAITVPVPEAVEVTVARASVAVARRDAGGA
jgi:hypothetical protein